jgi:hypothetical protein
MKTKQEKEVQIRSEIRLEQLCPHHEEDEGIAMRMPVILKWGGSDCGLLINQVGEPYCDECDGENAKDHFEDNTDTDLAFMLGKKDFEAIAEIISEKLRLHDQGKSEIRLNRLVETLENKLDELRDSIEDWTDSDIRDGLLSAVTEALKPMMKRRGERNEEQV